MRRRRRQQQQVLVFQRRGGRRKGAGRKRRGARRRVPHTRRAAMRGDQPVHVTLRILDGVGSIRNRSGFALTRRVMFMVMAAHADFRVVHTSIQGNHLHLICEAEGREALRRGIQGFKISFARRLNRELGRSGAVFEDRYHDEVLATPSQVRNCLAYVLNNFRKHGVAGGATMLVDPFSTGVHFDGWTEQAKVARLRRRSAEWELPRVAARSWLLAVGWKRSGRGISVYEVPSAGRGRRGGESVRGGDGVGHG